jgi:ubiquinone/menaquinone biosynthesis C-methylase UbiE
MPLPMASSPPLEPVALAASGPGLARVLEPEVMDSELEALDYDQMDHREVNARFVDDLTSLSADLTRVLDVGAGTAQIPIALCMRAPEAKVVAIDLAVHMLHLGSHNVERAGLAGVICLERRDAKALDLPDRSFTSVVSNSIVHHIPSPLDVLAEMVSVLLPSGWLFVRDLLRPTDDKTVRALVERYAQNENAHQKALFDASLRAALSLREIAELARRAGIDPAAVRTTSDRHWTLAWRKP